MQLSKPFEMTRYVQPACLLLQEAHEDVEIAYAVRLGQTEFGASEWKQLNHIKMDRCETIEGLDLSREATSLDPMLDLCFEKAPLIKNYNNSKSMN